MAIELSQATFKHLVQLYAVSGLAGIVAIAPQYMMGRWAEFGDAFDTLVVARFGSYDPPLPVLVGLIVIALTVFVWHIVSIVGLLRFRRWARSGLWQSLICLFVLYVGTTGFRPVFSSPFDDMFATVDSAILGSIVLLAYGKGLGSQWFVTRTADVKE